MTVEKIYHVETQEDYNALMVELKEQGYRWESGESPTAFDYWNRWRINTAIRINENKIINYCDYIYYKSENYKIEKYKAPKGIKFTSWFDKQKEIEELEGETFEQTFNNLKSCLKEIVAPLEKMAKDFLQDERYFYLVADWADDNFKYLYFNNYEVTIGEKENATLFQNKDLIKLYSKGFPVNEFRKEFLNE